MLADNDRRLLQLIVDQADPRQFELRLMARSILGIDDELREARAPLRARTDGPGGAPHGASGPER